MLLPIAALTLYLGVETLRGRRPALLDLLQNSSGGAVTSPASALPLVDRTTPLGIKAERVQESNGVTVIETLGDLDSIASTIRTTHPASKLQRRQNALLVSVDTQKFVVRPFRTANSDAGFVAAGERVDPAPAASSSAPAAQQSGRTTGEPPARDHAASGNSSSGSGRPPEIVLILDDVGFDHQPLTSAMHIDPNLNFAVLPNGQRSSEFARELDARGFEILCHLPMEPIGFPHVSPGPGAVLTSMSDEQIEAATVANVHAVPQARGVNNHMGSRATTDRRVMMGVLGALPKGMYFIDSRTTGGSLAARLAHELNIRTASRNVFLDDVRNEGAIRRQLAELAAVATQRGRAVGIGHMFPETVRVLSSDVPALRRRGFRFVRASQAVD